METQNAPILWPAAVKCRDGFDTLVQAANLESSRVKSSLGERDAKEMQDRYLQWASNLGALQVSASPKSLDHRLRDAPIVANAILKTLTNLAASIQQVIAIAIGDRDNRISRPTNFSDSEALEFDISDESDASSDSEKRDQVSTSEIEQLISAMSTCVATLFKTSAFIRRHSSPDKRKRASKTAPFDNRADIMYITERYSLYGTGEKEALATRMGEANARRRQYFKYRRDHVERLANDKVEQKNSEKHTGEQTLPAGAMQSSLPAKSVVTALTNLQSTAETEATNFLAPPMGENAGETPQLELAPSVVSYATFIHEPSENELAFPLIPREAKKDLPFICPYCQEVLILNGFDMERRWKKHIIRDLEPYLCTYPTCTLETFHSQRTWFDHELLLHRCHWVCPLCREPSNSPDSLKRHISQLHRKDFSTSQISSVIERSKRPVEFLNPNECPFCDEPWAEGDPSQNANDESLVVNIKQFREHVGHHMLQIALFALPRLLLEDEGSLKITPGDEKLDQDAASSGYRWVRDDCGRGWSAVSRKRAVFIALACFLSFRKNIVPYLLITLMGHTGDVNSVAFSPDGKVLASGADDNTVRLWDPAMGAVQHTFEDHTGVVNSVAFSPDGKVLASGADDNTVRLWDLVTGALQHTLKGRGEGVYSVSFSPDGKVLASGRSDGTVQLWTPATGALQYTLEGHSGSVWSVAFSPDGKVLASGAGGGDHTVRLWNPATGTVQRILEGHSGTVYSVAFSPNGKVLASGAGGNGDKVRLWDPATGAVQCTLEGHSSEVNTVAFSPDGKVLASGGGADDRTVRFWDPATGALQRTLEGHSAAVYGVAFSPDGKVLASGEGGGDYKIRLWNSENPSIQQHIPTLRPHPFAQRGPPPRPSLI